MPEVVDAIRGDGPLVMSAVFGVLIVTALLMFRSVTRAASYDEASSTYGFYLQDDWRVGSRLVTKRAPGTRKIAPSS